MILAAPAENGVEARRHHGWRTAPLGARIAFAILRMFESPRLLALPQLIRCILTGLALRSSSCRAACGVCGTCPCAIVRFTSSHGSSDRILPSSQTGLRRTRSGRQARAPALVRRRESAWTAARHCAAATTYATTPPLLFPAELECASEQRITILYALPKDTARCTRTPFLGALGLPARSPVAATESESALMPDAPSSVLM